MNHTKSLRAGQHDTAGLAGIAEGPLELANNNNNDGRPASQRLMKPADTTWEPTNLINFRHLFRRTSPLGTPTPIPLGSVGFHSVHPVASNAV